MFSNLVNANYEIKDVNLLNLRNRIVEENSLTPLDILKGFHEKSKIDMRYQSGITEQNHKDSNAIEEEYKHYISTEIGKNIQDLYDTEFNLAFEECKKECPKVTLEDVINYKNDKNKGIPVDVQNACFRFIRNISDQDRLLRNKIEKIANDYILSYIEKNFGDKYKINLHTLGFQGFAGLPHQLDTNAPIDINFSEVYECKNPHSGSFSDWITFEYDTHLGSTAKLKLYEYDLIDIFTHLSEDTAKEVFDNAINSIIYQNNSIGEIEYLQNLEAQPITINVNTKTGKYELIDGYKRLLYITDEKLLGYSAPVKFFTDLNDTQFLALLYAANIWKTQDKFHDRGFLFALKMRYGFEIPQSAYNIPLTSELATLQLYDFGGNLVRVSKTTLMNTLHCHKHLVNDVILMYNFLPKVAEKQSYDKNISDEIKFTIIEHVGDLRRMKDSDSQAELSEELITSIFEDDFVNKTCSKKHLSTRTYVINYFKDKRVYNRIKDILNESLIKNC